MKKTNFLSVITLFIFFSCGEKHKEKFGELTLLAKGIKYEVNFEDTLRPQWVKNVDFKKLIDVLIDRVFSGKIQAYSYFENKPLTKEDLQTIGGAGIDTIWVENPDTGEEEMKVIKKEFDPDEIKSIVFIEEWHLDEKNLTLEKKVTGMIPVRFYTKEPSTEIRKEPLFVVYFDKKYMTIDD